MLIQPNADSPLNCDAGIKINSIPGNLIRAGDLLGYKSLAEYYTHKFAIHKNDFQSPNDKEETS